MTDAMRSMLDELMGKQRNVVVDETKRTKLEYNDPDVCKHALAGLCPHSLFKNTRSDLGARSSLLVHVNSRWCRSDLLPLQPRDCHPHDNECIPVHLQHAASNLQSLGVSFGIWCAPGATEPCM